MMYKKFLTFPFLITLLFNLYSETPLQGDPEKQGLEKESLLAFDLSSGIEYPIETDLDLLMMGANATMQGALRIPQWHPWLEACANLSYSFLPVMAETSLSLFGTGIGPGIIFEPSPRLHLECSLVGGGYYGFFNEQILDSSGTAYENQQGGGGLLNFSSNLSFFVSPWLSIGVDLGYVNYLGLTQGLRAGIGGSFHVDGLEQKVYLREIDFNDIFPSNYKYYDEHPIGTVIIVNEERFPIRDVSVSIFVEQYMEKPTLSSCDSPLEHGDTYKIGINALLRNDVLDLMEVSRVTAEISVQYLMNGKSRQNTTFGTLVLQNRNAIVWNDDRKAAAFVTPMSPEILKLSKGVAGMVRKKGPRTVNQNIRMAMGIFSALSEYGLSYVIDPNTLPYEDAVKNTYTVDFLQYPAETLGYKGGDCDDLTVLFCSLLESVGIHTAFIMVPGHIFSAFSLDIPPNEAKRIFSNTNDLIFHDEKTWVPVETTMISDSFYDAWQNGIKQWRDESQKGNATIIPMSESWKTYESSGEPTNIGSITLPDMRRIEESYDEDLAAFISRELSPQVLALKNRINTSRRSLRLMNQLGVLYARYGKIEDAKIQFRRILAMEEYLPSMINLGNILYLEQQYGEALDIFKMAEKKDKENPVVLLSLARINYEFENSALVNSYFTRASRLAPELSEQFAYLASATTDVSVARAGDIETLKEKVIWEYGEEEEQ